MNKNSKGFAHLFLLFVIVIIAIGGIGFYAYKNKQTAGINDSSTKIFNKIALTPPITPSVETQLSSVESYWLVARSKNFSGWNTYTHKNHSFAIDLPPNWNFDSSIVENENNQKIGELSPGSLTITEEKITCNDFFERTIDGGKEILALETNVSFDNFSNGYEENIKSEELLVNGKKWYLLLSKVGVEPNEYGITSWYPHQYCYENQQKLFLITFYELSLPNKNQQLINQILSTFKFTE